MTKTNAHDRAPFILHRPKVQKGPIIIASPHSGTYYPTAFTKASALDPLNLRQSEDSFVDQIMAFAPDLGLPLLAATYPRAYMDVNRAPYELDPDMFHDPLPDHAITDSDRVRSGFGSVARIVGPGKAIYRDKMPFAEAQERITHIHHPYHHALKALIAEAQARYDHALLLDMHSMPASDHGPASDSILSWLNEGEADMVLGNRYGQSSDPRISAFVAERLGAYGYKVLINSPYAGGYTTSHYGKPETGVHVLQIEIRRALYMDEPSRTMKKVELARLSEHMAHLCRDLLATGLAKLTEKDDGASRLDAAQ